MSELSDYQKQVAKMRAWNTRFMLVIFGTVIVLFGVSLGYAIYVSSETRHQQTEIINYINKQRQRASTESAITRQGGDIIRCILNYPANQRTQEQINACYPGGSQQAWVEYRKEALGE